MSAWECMTWTVYEGRPGLESVRLVNGKPHAGEDRLIEALSRAGVDGWELVSAHPWSHDHSVMRYLFKHPKEEG